MLEGVGNVCLSKVSIVMRFDIYYVHGVSEDLRECEE